MKVLFLDVDGVLNCRTTKERFVRGGFIGIDPKKVALVKQIIKETGCEIVLSSSWRLEVDTAFHVAEHLRLYDMTPDNRGLSDRGCEIVAWLEHHLDVTKYAILDDNTDFHRDQPLFKTTFDEGLTEKIAEEVIDYLNKEQ